MRKTANYDLPIFEQGESPALVGDWNATMEIIDENLGGGGGGSGMTLLKSVKTGSPYLYIDDLVADHSKFFFYVRIGDPDGANWTSFVLDLNTINDSFDGHPEQYGRMDITIGAIPNGTHTSIEWFRASYDPTTYEIEFRMGFGNNPEYPITQAYVFALD